jgi:hypothetical protein
MSVIYINPYAFGVALDPDAAAYIAAVEAADSNTLEDGVKTAINAFVIGCKADGIWTAIKASCILAGARTRLGALTSLVGAPITSFNFADGDYNRKTGLLGNGTTKSLRTGLLANSLSNTSHHFFVNGSTLTIPGASMNFGGVYNGSSINTLFDLFQNSALREVRSSTVGAFPGSSATIYSGFISTGSLAGIRTSSTELRLYQNGLSVALASTSNTPSLPAIALSVFARNNNGTQAEHIDSRLNYFSFGNGLSETTTLALHDRVTTLINAYAAAIP